MTGVRSDNGNETTTIVEEFIEWMKRNGISCDVENDSAFDDILDILFPFDYYVTVYDVCDAREHGVDDVDYVKDFYSRVIKSIKNNIDCLQSAANDYYDTVILVNTKLERLLIKPLEAHMRVLTGESLNEDVDGEQKLREYTTMVNGINDQLHSIFCC